MATAAVRSHASTDGLSVIALTMRRGSELGERFRQNSSEAPCGGKRTEGIDRRKRHDAPVANGRKGLPQRTIRESAVRIRWNRRDDDDRRLGLLRESFERDWRGRCIAGGFRPGIPETEALENVAEHAIG